MSIEPVKEFPCAAGRDTRRLSVAPLPVPIIQEEVTVMTFYCFIFFCAHY
ncbi:hypothetical protein KCP78_07465 [Salmonella enterica subsp. enterica]|nr:hypothetical protein KCP78_07465 [Salmonella enterica subsp. enterica]